MALGVAAAVIFLTAIAPFIGAQLSPTATGYGVTLVLAQRVGLAVPIVVLGAIGLLYKPNRVAGYIVGCIAVATFMFIGSLPA